MLTLPIKNSVDSLEKKFNRHFKKLAILDFLKVPLYEIFV